MIEAAHILKNTFAKENSWTPLPLPSPQRNNGPSPRFFCFSSILQNSYPQGIIRHHINDVLKEFFTPRACLHGGGGPQIGEVTCGGSPHLSCKRDQIKMRDYMDRQVTPPKRVEYLTYMGSPTPMQTGCKWVFRPLLRLAHAFPAFSKNTTWSRASLLFPWDIVSDTFSSMRKTRFGGKV